MARRVYLILCLLTLALAACDESATPVPTASELKDFGTVCDKANDGQRVAAVGYLRLPDSFTGDMSVVLRLYETDDFSGTPIGVQTRFGAEANQAASVPDKFADTDLKVNMPDGKTVEYGTKVKVSGKVYFPLVDQEFKCGLENPLIELGQ